MSQKPQTNVRMCSALIRIHGHGLTAARGLRRVGGRKRDGVQIYANETVKVNDIEARVAFLIRKVIKMDAKRCRKVEVHIGIAMVGAHDGVHVALGRDGSNRTMRIAVKNTSRRNEQSMNSMNKNKFQSKSKINGNRRWLTNCTNRVLAEVDAAFREERGRP